jgi:hypothetical protein
MILEERKYLTDCVVKPRMTSPQSAVLDGRTDDEFSGEKYVQCHRVSTRGETAKQLEVDPMQMKDSGKSDSDRTRHFGFQRNSLTNRDKRVIVETCHLVRPRFDMPAGPFG